MTGRLRQAMWVAGAPARALLLGLIGLYRVTLSGWLGGQCRFSPTCSAYATEAIRSHGAIHGTILASRRILRCNPFGGSGFDPVPAAPPLYDADIRHLEGRHAR